MTTPNQTEPPAEVVAVAQFSRWLADHDDGALNAHLSEQMAAVVAAVRLTGRKGGLTLKVEVKPTGDMVVVTGEVAVRPPKVDPSAKAYFVDDAGNLSRNNPRQPELPGLKSVPFTPATEAREVSLA